MPCHILVGTRTLCGLDPQDEIAWAEGDSFVTHDQVAESATCSECREVFHRREMHRLGYDQLETSREIDPNLQHLWGEAPAVSDAFGADQEVSNMHPAGEGEAQPEPELEPGTQTNVEDFSLIEALQRIRRLDIEVDRLKGYISILTMALSEHLVIPSVAGDSTHLIRPMNFYNDEGQAHLSALRRCLQGGHRMHPVLVSHEQYTEGVWKFMTEPEVKPEDPNGPRSAWDRIKDD